MDYASNSDKDKKLSAPRADSAARPEKVITGVVITKKPSLGHRFKSTFFGGDGKSAVRYISVDVILPAVRNLVVDAITKGAERMVYGESRPRRPGGFQSSYPSRVQYNSPVMRPDVRPARLPDQGPQTRDANDLILTSRDEADMVIERMKDICDQFEVASVADLYDLCGLPVSPIDQKWGWTNLSGAETKSVREGWLLNLPRAEEI